MIAQEAGADRIELCDQISLGGTTPSAAVIDIALQKIHIDWYCMVRPRGGNFVYTDEEFEQMRQSVIAFKAKGVKGFVFGILNEDYSINLARNKELLMLAAPFPCTFHRAFDHTKNYKKALQDCIDIGFSTILSSGTHNSANEGVAVLKELVELAQNNITIMPGGGLRSGNCKRIADISQASFYHSSAITNDSETADREEIRALKALL